MSPVLAVSSGIALVIEAAIKYGPDAARAVKEILSIDDPTEAQWEVFFTKFKKPYDAYIAEAAARRQTARRMPKRRKKAKR